MSTVRVEHCPECSAMVGEGMLYEHTQRHHKKPPASAVPAPSVTLESISGAKDPLMEAAYLRAKLAEPRPAPPPRRLEVSREWCEAAAKSEPDCDITVGAPPPRETAWTAAQHKLVMKLVLYLRAGDCETCGAAKSCALCVELNEQLDAVNVALKVLRSYRNENALFERLSDALTAGNASTWDQIFHAAESSRAELTRLQQAQAALESAIHQALARGDDARLGAFRPLLADAVNELAQSPAPRRAAPPQWQPIETAPKDGKSIIGLTWNGEVGGVYWSPLQEDWRWAGDGWRGGTAPRLIQWQPMPLPDPPAAPPAEETR